jgi:glutathione S-transferase
MSEFTVHSIPGSPFGRSVLAMLEEKKATYRLAPVAPSSMKTPDYLKLHPFGRVPVLVHDGLKLYETQAILRYLDRVLPQPALTPADVTRAARMDQAMNINDWYLFHGVGNVIIFQRVIAPQLLGLAPNEDAIKAAMPKAHAVFDELANLLGEHSYFAGDTLSLADLLLAPAVDFFTLIPEWTVLGAPHANLVAWMKRMQERPSLKATTWERVTDLAKAA